MKRATMIRTAAHWLVALWGRDRAAVLAQEYEQAFAGRHLLLADLAKLGFETETPLVPGDPYQTHFNLGMQAFWQHIRERLDLSPGDLDAALQNLKEDPDE